ncbi:hypothetical protein S2091_2313 [Solimicrobium silvestre]|uniref:Uncharacterized protein n=1 Tax=Solimicrobium silvestre TaxID=2099400 RepID=A0A2S9GZ41_9BURK|nr:hypothetical protein S2091_2313 [Solimicrobium silvestre]
MFWFNHPQPIDRRKAVPELAVKQTGVAPLSTNMIIVKRPPTVSVAPVLPTSD